MVLAVLLAARRVRMGVWARVVLGSIWGLAPPAVASWVAARRLLAALVTEWEVGPRMREAVVRRMPEPMGSPVRLASVGTTAWQGVGAERVGRPMAVRALLPAAADPGLRIARMSARRVKAMAIVAPTLVTQRASFAKGLLPCAAAPTKPVINRGIVAVSTATTGPAREHLARY